MTYFNKFGSLLINGFHPVTIAYIDAMVVKPKTSRMFLIDQAIKIWDNSGVLSSTGFMYLLSSHNNDASRINLLNPVSGQNLLIQGAPTFTQDMGWLGNGTNYLYTPFLLNNALTKMTQNSVHQGSWPTTHTTVNGADIGINAAINQMIHCGYSAAGNLGAYAYMNGGISSYVSSGIVVVTTSIGHLLSNRVSSIDFNIYKNGVDVSTTKTGALTSSVIPANPGIVCASASNAGGRTQGLYHGGAGFTQAQREGLNRGLKLYFDNLSVTS